MPHRIDVLLPNTSQYGVLHHFSHKIGESLQHLGYTVRVLDTHAYTKTFVDSPPDFTLGFNGAPTNEAGEFLCDKFKVPHISCLVDPPYRFLNLQTSPYILVTCDDRACVDLFKTSQHPNYFFLPHGVEKELAPDLTIPKQYDIVFLGTFIDGESRRKKWSALFSKPVCEAMDRTAESFLEDSSSHFMSTLFQELSPLISEKALGPVDIAQVLQELELYVKARDRTALIRSIKNSPITIFGGTIDEDGWQSGFSKQSNVTIRPAVSYEEGLKIMQQAKIILNSGIKNVYGSHERVFSGLATGAAVVTNHNAFLAESFKDRESILFFRHNALDEVDDKIRFYLDNEPARIALAEEGRFIVMRSHTWDERLKTVLPQLLPIIL